MKARLLAITAIALLAVAALLLTPRSDDARHDGADAAAGDAAKASTRPDGANGSGTSEAVEQSANPETSGKIAERSASGPTDEPSAEERLNELLTPEQRAELADARAEAARHDPSDDPDAPRAHTPVDPDGPAVQRAREALRSLVLADPENWEEGYHPINQEYLSSNHPDYLGGGGSAQPDSPEDLPEDLPGDLPGEADTTVNIEEARQYVEILKRNRANHYREPTRQARFKHFE